MTHHTNPQEEKLLTARLWDLEHTGSILNFSYKVTKLGDDDLTFVNYSNFLLSCHFNCA